MDLLYTGRFSGFCIVSSDSDFARLAARIREQAVTVYGFGERKTPRPFITACDRFVYFDTLTPSAAAAGEASEHVPAKRKLVEDKPAALAESSAKKTRLDEVTLELLSQAVTATADEEGRANLAAVGLNIRRQVPDFDSRNYGYPRLSDLITAWPDLFDVEWVGDHPKVVMVRLKKTAT